MTRTHRLLFLLLALLLTARPSCAQPDSTARADTLAVDTVAVDTMAVPSAPVPADVPQAEPVILLLNAVAAEDTSAFAAVFARPIQMQLEDEGGTWSDLLRVWQEVVAEEFGSADLDELRYSFEGDAESGFIYVQTGERILPALRVVLEEGEWKLNEG